MKSSLKRSIFGLLFVFFVGATVNAQVATSSKDLPNLYKVTDKLYRGGQPTEAGIRQLKTMGIRTVINLRDDDERARRERSWVTNAGLRFINIPLSNILGPKHDKIATIIAEIEQSENHPVFIHCKRGADRTGTAIAVYRMSHDGWNADQANSEAKKFGFGWWQIFMKDYINDFYREHGK